ncbi:MAG: RDD family protein [Micromonosporaceae bacterium]
MSPAPSEGWNTASPGGRLLAVLIDWILCLVLAGVVAPPTENPIWAPLFLVAEYAIFTGVFGQTPGMWVAKVRCVSVADVAPIGVPRGLLRAVLMCLIVPVVIMDSYGRGLHDRAVGSIMLSARQQPEQPPRNGADGNPEE